MDHYPLRDVLRDEMGLYAIAQEFVDRRGRSVWMACTAGYDVLHEYLPRTISVAGGDLKGIQMVISNARFLTQNISSERFQYLNSVTKERILDEAKAIVKMTLVICESGLTLCAADRASP